MVDGPSHDNGGIEMSLAEGTQIWSDRLKHNGRTFASLTKPIINKIAVLEKGTEDNPNSRFKQNSIKLLNAQLDFFFDIQESNKQQDEMKRTLKKQEGGVVDDMGNYHYANGGIYIKPENRNMMAMGGMMKYDEGGVNGQPNNGPRNSLMASGNFETNPNMSKYGLNSEFSRAFGQNRNLNLGVNANLGATYNNMPSPQGEFSMPMAPTVTPTANFGATGSYHSGNNNFNANVNYNPYNQGVEGKVTYTKKFGMGGSLPKFYEAGTFNPNGDPVLNLSGVNTNSFNSAFNNKGIDNTWEQEYGNPYNQQKELIPVDNIPGTKQPLTSPIDDMRNAQGEYENLLKLRAAQKEYENQPFSPDIVETANRPINQPTERNYNPWANAGIGVAAAAYGLQNQQIDKWARPKNIQDVNLEGSVPNYSTIDLSAQRNSINQSALSAMRPGQFSSSAAQRAFNNKSNTERMRQLGEVNMNEQVANTGIQNAAKDKRFQASLTAAEINNINNKTNIENMSNYDIAKIAAKNQNTAQLSSSVGDVFANKSKYQNDLEKERIISNRYEKKVWNSTQDNTTEENNSTLKAKQETPKTETAKTEATKPETAKTTETSTAPVTKATTATKPKTKPVVKPFVKKPATAPLLGPDVSKGLGTRTIKPKPKFSKNGL
jgi:hypothetical protein